jgi:glycosyltransferase involved in cell wall biosynthesis
MKTMGLPVAATPVGGLREQVLHGEVGALADAVDAASLASAIKHVFAKHDHMLARIAMRKGARSPEKFMEQLRAIVGA